MTAHQLRYLFYAITLLTSSSLLFVIQPMVAKMIQPVLGGTPAVWNTAMVFFQALLLGGYLYAHVTTKWLGTRRQAILHLVIMFIGLAFLPIAFDAPGDPATLQHPALWLLITLIIGVGWPFFVVATSAPLLQKWFSTLDDPAASDPYHLYAASNAGSVLALLAYPFVIEPRIGLQAQSTLWMVAYLILCGFVAICAATVWYSVPVADSDADSEGEDAGDAFQAPPASGISVSWHRRGRWLLWAFIPSSLMLSITTFITTDIAPVPLLWIPPLAIYMLSFIIAFARHQPVPLSGWLTLAPAVIVAPSVMLLTDTIEPLWLVTAINFAALFVLCMAFHSLLATDRPHTDDLTEFYLWIALGGVLGGVFNALVAPVLFDRLLEYPFVLLAAALTVPAHFYGRLGVRMVLLASLLLGAGFWVLQAIDVGDVPLWRLALTITAAAVFWAVFAFLQHRYSRWTPVLLAGLVAVVLFFEIRPDDDELYADRSFFGTHRVTQSSSGNFHILYHGRTIHGAQEQDEKLGTVPLSYYYYTGPLGQVFSALEQRPQRRPIASVGLGTGAIATYIEADQTLDIFEIDPAVATIARDPTLFTFIDQCAGDCRITLGDGRLQLEAADDGRYELIVIDAYSSAAIPVHLLTREAIAIYMAKLHPQGILALHISSPYLDLEAPLARAAESLGLHSRIQNHYVESDDPLYNFYIDSSKWMVITHSEDALGPLTTDEAWQAPQIDETIRPWSDDYANLLDAYLF